MSFKHGIYINETYRTPEGMVSANSAIPFVVGTAGGQGATKTVPVNEPKLISDFNEYKEWFGYTEPSAIQNSSLKKFDWTLDEFAKAYFTLYRGTPAIFVNVQTPETIVEEVPVRTPATSTDIIGTYNTSTGVRTGLELYKEVYQRFNVVSSVLVCPQFSKLPAVAAAMIALANTENMQFRPVALIDLPSGSFTLGGTTVSGPVTHSTVETYKTTNSLADTQAILSWPNFVYGDELYSASSHLAGLLMQTDSQQEGIPFASPSNRPLKAIGLCNDAGSSVWLNIDQANALNAVGVNTAFNSIRGWVYWGNMTGAYSYENRAQLQVKDYFLPIRRMFNWLNNSLILNFWSRIDTPATRRQIEAIVDSANIWLNSLVAGDYIIGGRVEFNSAENSAEDLMQGKVVFHVYFTPPSPMQEIDFLLEYDASYMSSVIGEEA